MKRVVFFVLILGILLSSSAGAVSDVVMLETQRPVQGEVFKISVISPSPIESAYVEFQGDRIYLKSEGKRAEGYFGFDLASPPGEKVIRICVVRGGEKVEIERKLVLEDGKFPVQRIDGVPDNYVNPDQESLKRIMREKSLLDSVWKSSSEKVFWSGDFVAPLRGFRGNGFGRRRIINGQPRSPHTGLDCSAPEGTPVFAINRGIVRVARNLFFSGNSVIIDHGGGLFSMYFHLKDLRVAEGQVVEKGTVIGTVGMTGRVTGPHLHFGVRMVSQRVNPERLIR